MSENKDLGVTDQIVDSSPEPKWLRVYYRKWFKSSKMGAGAGDPSKLGHLAEE